MSRKVIITCAVTGGGPINPRYPAALDYPVSTEQIADASIAAARAGTAIVHLHARDPDTGEESVAPERFRAITDRIRASGVDVLINLTCGIGGSLSLDAADESLSAPGTDILSADDRVRHLELCRPDIASIDVVTANQPYQDDDDAVYLNTPRTLRRMAERFRDLGVKPEIEVFNPGDIPLARTLIDEGLIAAPAMFQFVLGVRWCAPFTPAIVAAMRELLPPGASWTAMAIGRDQMPAAALSIIMGGHVRVGIEDNIYLDRGVFATNVDLVERAAALVRTLGHQVATPDEARAMLGLAG